MSVEAVHAKLIWLEPAAPAVNPDGAVGGVVSPEPEAARKVAICMIQGPAPDRGAVA